MNDSLPAELPRFRYLIDREETRVALGDWQSFEIIGLDTETFRDRQHNHSHVSLIQLAPPDGTEVLIIDALAVGVEVETLRSLVESPAVKMCAHNARFDEGVLQRAGLLPAAFIDTLRLSREALRLPSYSLRAVVAHLFGIALDKSFQRSNWRRRPLTQAQLDYAAMDAYITLRVYEELERRLTEQNRWDDALCRATLAPVGINNKRTSRQRRQSTYTPPRALTEAERRALTQLKKWRLEKSFEARIPAYMICPDRTLEQLILDQPETLDALLSIHGLGAAKISRYGEELLQALAEFSGLLQNNS
ncbi:MAG: HRDC domain-containing protein [Pyrinomonadaceae bacterium]